MKVLGIVPARSGSEGFPDKNIARIGNKTLLELAVQVSIDCISVDEVYISTDSSKYESLAIKAGARSKGLRPFHLATDTARTVDVVIDLLSNIAEEYDAVALIQPTSPVRSPSALAEMIKIVDEQEYDAAVSIGRLEEPHPYKLKVVSENEIILPFIDGTTSEIPRQQLPEVYRLNGAFYVTRVDAILRERSLLPRKTFGFIMSETFNIDSEIDYLFLKYLHETGRISIYGIDF